MGRKLTIYYYLLKNIIKNSFLFKKSYKDVKAEQFGKLQKIFKYAYYNTKFYRKKYNDAGIKPCDIKTFRDFNKVPFLTRDELIRNFPEGIVNKKFKPGKNCFLVATSGSTGQPIRVLKTYDSIFSTISLGSKGFMQKAFNLSEISILTILVYAEETIEQVFTDFLLSVNKIPSKRVNALDEVEEYIKSINDFKPTILFTYPSVLKDICLYLENKPREVFSPRLIFTSAEILEKGFVKNIQKHFKTSKFIDTYFCTEGGILAVQCNERDKMHVMDNKVYLELIKDGQHVQAGEEGEVIITDLHNKATPIIRYNGLKDIAKFSKYACSCGKEGTFLEMVAGRKVDSIITPKGRIINPFRLTEIISIIDGVGKYQVIQKTKDSILIKIIVISSEVSKELISKKINTEFTDLLDEDIKIKIEFVSEIKRDEGTGMFQLVKSEVI